MAKKTTSTAGTQTRPAQNSRINHFSLFAKQNRGLLLDLMVFALNLSLMRLLAGIFMDLFRQADQNNPLAKLVLTLTCVAMWILPAAGAVMRRWHFHLRYKAQAHSKEEALAGCLFNPLFYFCLNLVLVSVIIAALGEQFLGRARMDTAAVFVSLILAGLTLTIIQTFLIYQYFSPPKRPPRWEFLRRPESELLGDICLFLNMVLFQVAWNSLTFASLGRPSGITEFVGRLFFLSFIAMLIYFPPRMFYLAEDINRPRTWLMMLVANSPVILRVLFGTGSAANWN